MTRIKIASIAATIACVVIVFTSMLVTSSQAAPTEFSGQNAYNQLEILLEYGPRTTGSAESVYAGNYILDYLDGFGWETSDAWYTLEFDGPLLVPARNLMASMGEGSAIIIGGHYDSRVFTDQDPDPELRFERALGANDNGSGTVVLMEMARVISEHYIPQQEIRFVFFDAEDNPGIRPWGSVLGSTLYVQNLDMENDPIDFVVILDMVGDMEQFIPIEANSENAAPDVVNGIWDTAESLGYGAHITREPHPSRMTYSFQDDHTPFIRAGIPAVLLLDIDYPYWHTTGDTLDKISVDSLDRVGQTMITYLEREGIIVPK